MKQIEKRSFVSGLTATVILAAAIFALAFPGYAQAADTYCGNASSKRAVVLIHGGSFGLGGPYMTQDSCRAFAAKGYYVINSDYPLGDLLGAERYLGVQVTSARKGGRKVFAYGESAGGGLAALLASRSLVNAAFAWAPVSDLYRWKAESERGFVNWSGFRNFDSATLIRMSASNWASSRSTPLLVVHGRSDTKVPLAQSTRLKARYPAMTLQVVAGGHAETEPSFLSATSSALTWLSRW